MIFQNGRSVALPLLLSEKKPIFVITHRHRRCCYFSIRICLVFFRFSLQYKTFQSMSLMSCLITRTAKLSNVAGSVTQKVYHYLIYDVKIPHFVIRNTLNVPTQFRLIETPSCFIQLNNQEGKPMPRPGRLQLPTLTQRRLDRVHVTVLVP